MLSAFCAINSSMYFPLYFLFYSLSYYQEGGKKQMQQRQVFVFLSRQTVHIRKARVSVSGSK